ncbi:MAG: hypothetical protein L0228_09900 [Planctomycetes bacterium]|nr:hypothetical protein [Planctomycetota bacterium]
MKARHLTSVLATALVMGVQSAQAQSFDISFDGFCDGMHIEYGADLNHGGQRTGCAGGAIIGNRTGNVGSTPFPTRAVGQNTIVPDAVEGGPGFHVIFLLNSITQEWCNYTAFDGAVPTLGNCGTFSFGAPAAADAVGKSTIDFILE